jgi:hypothetical protein
MRVTLANIPITISGSFLRVAGINEKEDHFHEVCDPRAILEELKMHGHRADIFTFWQRLPETQPRFPYYFEWDNVAAVPLTTFDAWFKKQIPKKTREKIRKSSRAGIEVGCVPFDRALVQGIVDIFNESPIRQGRVFSNFGKAFEDVELEWSQDLERSEFLGAYYHSELVGFIKLLSAGTYGRTSGTICKLAHRDKAPMNALIAEAVRVSISRGFSHLVYGRFAYGNKGVDSLSDFKRHNGFEKIDLPRYYIPITATGKLALALGFHRGFLARLPGPVLQLLLSARRNWYRRIVGPKAPEA